MQMEIFRRRIIWQSRLEKGLKYYDLAMEFRVLLPTALI